MEIHAIVGMVNSTKKAKLSCEGEGVVSAFSLKHWDRTNREDVLESATSCHDAQVEGPCRVSIPFHLTVLTSKL